jgi:hypothetical protein
LMGILYSYGIGISILTSRFPKRKKYLIMCRCVCDWRTRLEEL